MPVLERLYYNAVFGALGGLLGWMLFAILGDQTAAGEEPLRSQMLLGGACIGGVIGYFVVSVEAIRDRSLVRFCRLASYGVVLGAVGGAAGLWLGDEVNYRLIGRIGAGSLLGTALARGLGWMLLGVAVGASEGVASRSRDKLSYGTLGGALGGFIGGVLFALLYARTKEQPGAAAMGSAAGLAILGACIGALSALVRAVFQPASVRVVRGWQEGREYPLEKAATLLGRDEHADIALFRDMTVARRHAVIRREGQRFRLVPHDDDPEVTRVNGQSVHGGRDLADGDRIELGNIVLRFQARAALGGRKARARN
jgi:hypothetical protein